MSATRGNGEHWKSLESVGISRKELALAEALQMEYDALSRLRQDKEENRAKQRGERPLISWDDPAERNGCAGIKAARGLSGSDPTLSYNVPVVPEGPPVPGPPPGPSPPQPDPQPWLKGPLAGDYLYIFEGSGGDFLGEPLNGTSPHDGGGSSPKKLSPPPLPPRHPLWSSPEGSQRSGKGSPPSSKGPQPRDINMFSAAHERAHGKLLGRRISEEDPYGIADYGGINDAITCLNLKSTYESEVLREAARGWKEGRSIFEKESSGKPVARSKTMPPQVPPRTYVSRFGNRKNLAPNKNHRISIDPVRASHCKMPQNRCFGGGGGKTQSRAASLTCPCLCRLRSGYSTKDYSLTGLVWSAVNLSPEQLGHGVSLKVTVVCDSLREPLTFTCDCSSTVDLLIYQALCYTHDELHAVDVEDFMLKICGLEEFLQNKHALGSHEYIQHCRKFDIDIRLQLMKRKGVRSDLARTANDDQSPSTLNHYIHLQERPIKQTISRQALSLLFDTFHNEVDAFLAAEGDFPLKAERVIQSVMAICNALAAVECQEITAALNQMPPCPSRMQPKIQKDPNVLAKRENRERIVESLTAAILNLVELYCSTFNADFQTAVHGSREHGVAQEARLLSCPLSFTVYATHRIPITWAASYEDFYLSCSLSHGGKELCSPLLTRKAHVYKYLFHLIIWDQQICFPVQVNRLPRETLLSVTLFAVPVPPPGSSSDANKQRRVPEALGWVTTPLFNFRVLTCGRKLLGLWPATQDNSRARSSAPNFHQPDSVILQIDFPTSAFEVKFTSPPAAEFSPKYEFSSLGEEDQCKLREAMQKKSLYWYVTREGLTLLLAGDEAGAQRWQSCLPAAACHQSCALPSPLWGGFPDQEVRRTAVQWIDSISDTELLDYLPQLVQALKYECYLDSPLVRFLLKRAICDLKITHYFFWLLKDGLKDSQFSIRYQYLLAALLCCCGKGLREEFDRQCLLVNTLARLAQQVRDAAPSARQGILREGLEDVKQFFKANGSCRLPLSPSLLVKGIVPRDCSYFNSNAVPLKLSFQNVDPLGENIRVIFKCGDDLRQDMLTLQMIRIMNKIWVQEGLDMRMVIFRCFSTGRGRGMVEMIPNAETLRKIQVEHGVTGSFKDRPLADWLQKHNPEEDEYEKAVENFIYSCAGCCVATYVLGICDRHNDNIMLKTTGHMFHIDFGRFLGHAQMFGNIKRDRAPFVFTSDMAYVINGGDKPSSRFHDFVDLCCQAYNLIRKHTHLFLNLLGLMLSCGIPELSDLEDLKYVYDALRPQDSDADATTYFTRLIESSLGSVATKLNFFIHNLAQMKFTGSDARPTLSFAPRTHTIKTSGRIRDVFLCRHERVFNPSKGYVRSPSHVTASSFPESSRLEKPLKLLQPHHEPHPDRSQLPQIPHRWVNPTLQPLQGWGLPPCPGQPIPTPNRGAVAEGLSRSAPQLVYDGIPRGDLQQRELRLSVLSEEGFWENILLGEVGIRLRDLDLAQEKMGWFALGSRGHGTL
uniref:Phosphatidylinositol-4-phosphate 3-kinase catalytic subunit type 2 beta n=1 Tax=Otus sunia TaxID=257818 RepID=A0A8C8ALD0_9STRI